MNFATKILIGLVVALILLLGLNFGLYNYLRNGLNKKTTTVYSLSQSLGLKPEKNESDVSFLAVGDIMLSRYVAEQMAKRGKDANWPFKNMTTELASTDFNFGNLESPFSGNDDYPPAGSLVFNAPKWTLPGLINNNFKVLNLANNHAFDQGHVGITYTKNLLDKNNIVSVGIAENLNDAWQGQVYTVNNIRIGFIGASYSSENDGGQATNNYVARTKDFAKLKQSITDLKKQSDFIVVTMHAGVEYTRNPINDQVDFAHAAIDNGADIIIGAHPHWIQTTENYKGKPIFYSLGNFIFDQMVGSETEQGLTLKISLHKETEGAKSKTTLKQIELLPIIIENYGQPRLANETESIKILNKINLQSTQYKLTN